MQMRKFWPRPPTLLLESIFCRCRPIGGWQITSPELGRGLHDGRHRSRRRKNCRNNFSSRTSKQHSFDAGWLYSHCFFFGCSKELKRVEWHSVLVILIAACEFANTSYCGSCEISDCFFRTLRCSAVWSVTNTLHFVRDRAWEYTWRWALVRVLA